MAAEVFATSTSIEMGAGQVVTAVARDKAIVLDEPEALGGTDRGMNPVEALLGALGACKCIVAKSFAADQGVRLRAIAIELEGTLDPDGFTGADPQAKVGFSTIRTRYRIDAENTDAELDAFIAFIDGHCPVMDTIVHPPSFEHTVERVSVVH